jgi:xylulokinase
VYLLGIDVGTGGTRAMVIDPEGRLLASATEDHRAFASPQIGWAEQDPLRLVAARAAWPCLKR